MGGIYAIEHIPTNKMYVGSSIDFRVRRNQHFSDLRRNRHTNLHLQRAFAKYGESNFRFIVLEHAKYHGLGYFTEKEKAVKARKEAEVSFGI